MADVGQLFGSDSEDEEKTNNKGQGSGEEGNKSGSDSSSDSGSNSSSSDDSGDEKSKSGSPRPKSPAGSGPASPAGSGPASPSGSGPASPAANSPAASPKSAQGSPPGSPAAAPASPTKSAGSSSRASSPSSSKSGSGSEDEGAEKKSAKEEKSKSASPAADSDKGSNKSPAAKDKDSDSGSDSDIPTTKKKALLGSDSGSDDEVGVKRQRLPSDSGSDPEAVRATAEDIFGEADDISEDEKEKNEQEEKEEEIPETRIEVEIPRVVADLGNSLSFAKLPNFLSVETRPFDPNSYEDEIDEDEVMDEEGRARLKLKVENTIRWRYAKEPGSGELTCDEFGEKIRETNAKVIRWSDGSMSLHLGTEIFDMFSMPMQDHNHLYIRQGTGLQGQAMFKSKLSFRPHSTDSFTHRKMTMSLADRSTKSAKIKVLPIAGVDPELSKTDNIKKEEERLRASIRRENQQRRTRERAHARHGLSASFLDDDDSIAAIKNKYKRTKAGARPQDYSSDSADEEYETDGEDDMRRNRLQKAKRLADSDSDNSDAGGSDEISPKKKAKVVSDDDSD